MDEKQILCALALNSLDGIGAVTYRKLVDRFGSPEKVFKATREELSSIPRITKAAVDAICSAEPLESGNREIEEAKRRGYKIIIYGCDDYPELLKQIHDPPPVLYVAGNLYPRDALAVAVVGSRDPTDYGRHSAYTIAGDLARAGVTIVSGMARGIDSAAHKGAIESGGRTIAVLGCGLDVVYPPENYKLFESIVETGAVVSSFPIGTEPDKKNFPMRNAIISGLSLGVIVVQATRPDSGSLITARHALDQGREVFAIPGDIGNKSGRATNELIKKGQAKLIENFKDVLEEILPQFDTGDKAAGTEPEPKPKPAPKLDGDEKIIWEKIGDSARHIDIVARECNLPVHRTATALLQLELKGLIEQKPGKMFIKVIF